MSGKLVTQLTRGGNTRTRALLCGEDACTRTSPSASASIHRKLLSLKVVVMRRRREEILCTSTMSSGTSRTRSGVEGARVKSLCPEYRGGASFGLDVPTPDAIGKSDVCADWTCTERGLSQALLCLARPVAAPLGLRGGAQCWSVASTAARCGSSGWHATPDCVRVREDG
eukprot:6175514-Pleurochrysis_carterae.AAC.5